jgi:iron complex transport system ATP-binding protein
LLQAADVTFAYGARRVLDRVSMQVPDGGFVGVLGPNGSGKTTLLRVLAGTLKPSSGRVLIDGVDVNVLDRRTLARRMSVVPQETRLAFDYRVIEVVLMGRYPHLGTFEVEGPHDLSIAREALKATGTASLENRAFATLSGGEKQRVVIAAALAQITASTGTDGALLLLDEPTAALDLAYQLEIAGLLRTLQRRSPVTIVVSTHDLNFAASLCRTLVLIRDGEVLASGPAEAVLTPDAIRVLYGVEAEVTHHEAAGHLVVVPVRRSATAESTVP